MNKAPTDVQLMRVESKGVFAVRDILAQFERLTRRAEEAERKVRLSREHSVRLEAALAELTHGLTALDRVTCTPRRVREIVDKALNFKNHYPCF